MGVVSVHALGAAATAAAAEGRRAKRPIDDDAEFGEALTGLPAKGLPAKGLPKGLPKGLVRPRGEEEAKVKVDAKAEAAAASAAASASSGACLKSWVEGCGETCGEAKGEANGEAAALAESVFTKRTVEPDATSALRPHAARHETGNPAVRATVTTRGASSPSLTLGGKRARLGRGGKAASSVRLSG